MRRTLLLLGLFAACSHAKLPSAAQQCVLASSAAPLELVVLGSGGPGSFGRAASGYLIRVDGVARILVDVGSGTFLRLGQLGVDLQRLDTVLLTHLHIDHAGDLPDFIKARDLTSDSPLDFHIRGPEGRGLYPATTRFLELLFGDAGAFAYLPGFRNQLRLDVADLPIAPAADPHRAWSADDLHVTSIAVDHGDVPALAYRIDYAQRAIVISGDLASRDDNLIRLAQGAQLLVYDATLLDRPTTSAPAPSPLYDLHTAPARIGQVASAAHVDSLLLSHISPAVERDQDAVLTSVRASYSGQLRLARDCLQVPVAP